jgi:hypothetical protein
VEEIGKTRGLTHNFYGDGQMWNKCPPDTDPIHKKLKIKDL